MYTIIYVSVTFLLLLNFVLQVNATIDHKDENHLDILKEIICIGDSLTYGEAKTNKYAYPTILQEYVFNKSFIVSNYGFPGSTISSGNKFSYWNTTNFHQLIGIREYPEIQVEAIIIMFGTNDSKDYLWNESQFIEDYNFFIRLLKKTFMKAVLYIAIPPPVLFSVYHIQIDILNNRLPLIIKNIAQENEIGFIDFHKNFGRHSMKKFLFMNETELKMSYAMRPRGHSDGVHPNTYGYLEIAHAVSVKLFGPSISYKLRHDYKLRNEEFENLWKHLKLKEAHFKSNHNNDLTKVKDSLDYLIAKHVKGMKLLQERISKEQKIENSKSKISD